MKTLKAIGAALAYILARLAVIVAVGVGVSFLLLDRQSPIVWIMDNWSAGGVEGTLSRIGAWIALAAVASLLAGFYFLIRSLEGRRLVFGPRMAERTRAKALTSLFAVVPALFWLWPESWAMGALRGGAALGLIAFVVAGGQGLYDVYALVTATNADGVDDGKPDLPAEDAGGDPYEDDDDPFGFGENSGFSEQTRFERRAPEPGDANRSGADPSAP
ncbi:MAG: hypothetical protein ACFB6R_05290 [Alphaproteobacteria bacterium]